MEGTVGLSREAGIPCEMWVYDCLWDDLLKAGESLAETLSRETNDIWGERAKMGGLRKLKVEEWQVDLKVCRRDYWGKRCWELWGYNDRRRRKPKIQFLRSSMVQGFRGRGGIEVLTFIREHRDLAMDLGRYNLGHKSSKVLTQNHLGGKDMHCIGTTSHVPLLI